jgi:tRNA A37 threonylcarbamoyladenosine biosynthesis protein TsaE
MDHEYLVKFNNNFDIVARKILIPFSINDQLIIFINGNMGVGKTSLCNSFAKIFHVDDLSSSSYGLVNSCIGTKKVIHSDFYRYHFNDHFFDEEIFPLLDTSYLLMIEWAHPCQLINNVPHLSISLSITECQDRYVLVSTM